ncbi:MAG: hypothetical protein AB7P04_06835 [Bacteriovoracia bacterium]
MKTKFSIIVLLAAALAATFVSAGRSTKENGVLDHAPRNAETPQTPSGGVTTVPAATPRAAPPSRGSLGETLVALREKSPAELHSLLAESEEALDRGDYFNRANRDELDAEERATLTAWVRTRAMIRYLLATR